MRMPPACRRRPLELAADVALYLLRPSHETKLSRHTPHYPLSVPAKFGCMARSWEVPGDVRSAHAHSVIYNANYVVLYE